MSQFRTVVWSSVGKKILTGLTGLALILFLVVHLLGNLLIYFGPDAINGYAHFLESIFGGWFVVAFELGLILLFLLHIIPAVWVALLDKYRARPIRYKKSVNARGKSRKTLSSTTMLYTGGIILFFVIIHVTMFKFRVLPQADGHGGDYYATVVQAFKTPWIAAAYVAVMILIGFHLRHGFWSAFQSLGLNNDRWIGFLYGLGLVLALLFAIGFLYIPVYIYFFVDPVMPAHAMLGGF